MNNFIFKSPRRLIKNSSIDLAGLERHIQLILLEQRHQRSDLDTISKKIDRLLVDKHLQMQVDEYFKDSPHEDSSGDLD